MVNLFALEASTPDIMYSIFSFGWELRTLAKYHLVSVIASDRKKNLNIVDGIKRKIKTKN